MSLITKELKSIASYSPHPFKIVWTTDSNNISKIRVSPGTIADILATNWDTDFSASTSSGIYYVKFIITTSGLDLTSAKIVVDTSIPKIQPITKNKLNSTIEVLLGIIKDGTIIQIVSSNTPGNVVEQFRIQKTDGQIGSTISYDYYYRLGIGVLVFQR